MAWKEAMLYSRSEKVVTDKKMHCAKFGFAGILDVLPMYSLSDQIPAI